MSLVANYTTWILTVNASVVNINGKKWQNEYRLPIPGTHRDISRLKYIIVLCPLGQSYFFLSLNSCVFSKNVLKTHSIVHKVLCANICMCFNNKRNTFRWSFNDTVCINFRFMLRQHNYQTLRIKKWTQPAWYYGIGKYVLELKYSENPICKLLSSDL